MPVKKLKNEILKLCLFLNFIASIYIPCLGHYVENISIIYFEISLATFFVISIIQGKYKITGFLKYVVFYYGILMISSIINNGELLLLLFEFGVSGLSFLIWNSLDKKQVLKYISIPTLVFEILTYLNLLIVIMYPDGLYHVSTVRNYYLFDHVNVAIRYLLPGSCLILLNSYIRKNKVTLRAIIYISTVILTLILTKPVTAIIGYALFLLLLVILPKKMNFIKIFSPLKSFIYAGTLSFLIIVVNIQEYFANFIINILHKDVTFTGRTDIWNEALFYLKNNFIFGLGRLQSEKRTMMLGASSAHNQFLNFMFEGGIVLLGYIFIAIYCFSKRLLSCKNRKIIILFSATMFSYAFMWISEPFSYSGTFAMFFLWMLMYRAKELFSEE